MIDELDNAQLIAVFKRLKPHSPEELLAQRYASEFTEQALRVTQQDWGNEVKRGKIQELHTKLYGKVCNLADPMFRDPALDLVASGPSTAKQQATVEALLMVTSEAVVCMQQLLAAWDAVRPIGWVASAKGDPKLIPAAIAKVRELVAKIKLSCAT